MKNKLKKELNCQNCGSNFLSNSSLSKFCGTDCRKEFHVKEGKEFGLDYVICQICNRATSNVTGSHLKNHPEWTAENYKKEFNGFATIPTRVLEKIREGSKKAGCKMREETHRTRLRNSFLGNKNPMHKSKTTEEQRKSVSPFSPDFYLKRNELITIEEAKKLAREKTKSLSIKSWVKKEYWIERGFTEEDAKKLISEKQSTFSLEKCLEKHGEIEGNKIWKERQEKWKSKVFNSTTHISRGTSKIGDEFIKNVLNILDILEFSTLDLLYGKHEKFIKANEGSVYKYDLTYQKEKKIVEFNGDYWHCNPIFYNFDYYNKVKLMTAKEIWDFDLEKQKTAESHGYKLLIIWENDYRENKKREIMKCVDFIISN